MSAPNALANQTSPYLQQHADNPVQWYPWGTEALQLAKQQNKPILLSIGYSACHWCHVMAHESFENEQTAAIMNQHFINIKVDREERPDLDKIYQLAHNMLAQKAGGWPLTMFLTPDDHIPFFGGTYFPPEPRHGLPAFNEILQKVAGFYQQGQEQIQQQNTALATALHQYEHLASEQQANISATPLHEAIEQLSENFDSVNGGFGGAPKFPHLTNLEFLFDHYWVMQQQGKAAPETLEMALFSLKKMVLGGIYDHIGGGLCRYSVDELWMIPHFEKMLYDNGPFLSVCAKAYQICQLTDRVEDAKLFKRVLQQSADWVMREMQSPEGGFYSTLDADSEGEEGKFYVWQQEDVKQLLDEETYELFATQFGLNWKPNFEGAWHLHTFRERSELAEKFNLPIETVDEKLDQACTILFKQREQRIRPHRDEKTLVSWNGLMIKGLAMAGRVLGRDDYVQAAQKAVDFIQQTMWERGRLKATYKDGKAHLNAYLDDYAFLLDGLLELLQTDWRNQDLSLAIQLAEVLLADFADPEKGGFYFTAHSHEALISRPKSYADESMPSGNGVAASALHRLGHLLVEARFYTASEKVLNAAWAHIEQLPYAHGALLLALNEFMNPSQTIILRGKPELVAEWKAVYIASAQPHQVCFAIPKQLEDDMPVVRQTQADIVAYVCTGMQCDAPITDIEAFKQCLKAS
ncbi:thioredoxin domain-containing protein [Candidatus Albibeggiatoa sp. nov. NOAA]|uniref:thioredoxin domain-containing protein n=1 Tax=Candidatus Albibeggiatoa sp. nov. NOAA TaxID=3162724 RepID=UPI0032FA91E2|nr:thioredoxin domain-containing protein [Thiotrichaceae bacterium]